MWKAVDWIYLAHITCKWLSVVKRIVNPLVVSYETENWAIGANVKFSRRTLFIAVSLSLHIFVATISCLILGRKVRFQSSSLTFV